jgi:FKBP-type peptidyl-prolyl cis-trans isomerase
LNFNFFPVKATVFFLLLFVCFALTFSACKQNDVNPYDPAKQAAADDALIQKYLTIDSVTNAVKTSSGIYHSVQTAGTGQQVQAGKTVTVHYIGRFMNGQIFDSSYKTGSPFNFKVNAGQVIKGWDEGLQLMQKGEKALLYIPSGLAYGLKGAGNTIPPNTVLKFEITVLDIN